MPAVSIVNRTTLLTDAHIAPVVAALRMQMGTFAPAWGTSVTLEHVLAGETASAGNWALILLDDSDLDGDLGYHELTAEGLPLGKVFVATDVSYALQWSVTLGHELMEMLVDPWVTRMARFPDGSETPIEVADPVQDDLDGIVVGGVLLSNATLPAYWAGGPGPYDLAGVLDKPFPALSRGGYMMIQDSAAQGGWRGVYGETTPIDRGRLPRARRRLSKRSMPPAQWRRSTAI